MKMIEYGEVEYGSKKERFSKNPTTQCEEVQNIFNKR